MTDLSTIFDACDHTDPVCVRMLADEYEARGDDAGAAELRADAATLEYLARQNIDLSTVFTRRRVEAESSTRARMAGCTFRNRDLGGDIPLRAVIISPDAPTKTGWRFAPRGCSAYAYYHITGFPLTADGGY